MEQITKMSEEEIAAYEEQRNEFYSAVGAEQELRLEYALRFMIPCPIKGEITLRKCKWRGLCTGFRN